jgi:hypothetical protein
MPKPVLVVCFSWRHCRPALRCQIWCRQDYTLIHYDVAAWEGKAYAYGLKYLQDVGCPVGGLTFDPDLVIRGLIVDKELGNLVKVDRFGCARSHANPGSAFHLND